MIWLYISNYMHAAGHPRDIPLNLRVISGTTAAGGNSPREP